MAIIISNNRKRLFISYAPGMASTSLEQYLRNVQPEFENRGFYIFNYPQSEFGIGDSVDRHVSYVEFLSHGGECCDYVATGTRNPFSYYFGEYKRMISKWAPLLSDKNSWIYSDRSRSTLELTLAALKLGGFDEWFFGVLKGAEKEGYININGDHLAGATHYIRTESSYASLAAVVDEVLKVNIFDFNYPYPEVNVTGYRENYRDLISKETKELALRLFYTYNEKFGYSY